MKLTAIALTLAVGAAGTALAEGSDPVPGVSAPQGPTAMLGAQVFEARCTLCHGKQGFGDGVMPLSLKGRYPDANLHKLRKGSSLAEIELSVREGGIKGRMSEEMPPWFEELSDLQIRSVSLYVQMLNERPEEAFQLLDTAEKVDVSSRHGRQIFQQYCVICHGKEGKGDGKMIKIIKNPPPFNLTLSRVPDDYLRQIILNGGEKMGRSPRMPPWRSELTDAQVDSLILFLHSLRKD